MKVFVKTTEEIKLWRKIKLVKIK